MTQSRAGADGTPVKNGERTTPAQATATAVAGWVAFVGGSLLYSAVSGRTPTLVAALWLLASPPVLIWVVLALVLGLLLRRGSGVVFAVVAIALAPVATVIAALLPFGQGMTATGAVWVALVWQAAGLVGAAVVGALAGFAFRRRTDGHPALVTAAIVLLAVGGTFAFTLPMLWFSTYFSIWEPAPAPSAEAIGRYQFAAASALFLLALSLVFALVARRRGLAWLVGGALVLTLLAAFVFQIPQGRFWPSEPDVPEPRNTHVCFGTTGDCPGG